ncbi:MAG: hypothetical protein RBU37_23185 [Myxococcota bacterium]|jgi:hypothetical protein|nr:hypothetical protein [Myxococcota bacterium]
MSATVALDDKQRRVLDALRKSKGRVTVGDVVSSTGLSSNDSERALRKLLSTHEGHLEVSEDGDLIYLFDPKLVRRDERTAWQKFKEEAYKAFKFGFKIWIMLMLVVYFVIYLVMAIAALVALSQANRDSERSDRGPGIPIFWLLYLFWTPDWHYGSHYYGYEEDSRRHSRRQRDNVPFYKKVFAFVFGPDERVVDPVQRDRDIAQFIRSRKGVLSTAELVRFTGDSYAKADSEMARLVGAFDGDVKISDEGEVLYVFPQLMLSAGGADSGRDAAAWHRLEIPKKVTGNTGSANALITFFNGFNLFFAIASPSLLFPILQIQGTAANIGLVWIPLIFSILFFAVPAIRSLGVGAENTRRHSRNVRRMVLKSVFESVESKKAALSASQTKRDVERALEQVKTNGKAEVIADTLKQTSAEFEAEVEVDERQQLLYTFPTIERALNESEKLRRSAKLDQQKLGEIVFATADSNEEAEARELAQFERELGGTGQVPNRQELGGTAGQVPNRQELEEESEAR